VFLPSKNHFDGLFGVFAESLPDAWGRLLLDRVLQKNGKRLDEITILDRLAIVGSSGMGALCYQPEYEMESERASLDFDTLAMECKKVLESEYVEELDTLYKLGGTSGGARPKAMMAIDGVEWIVKFPAHGEGRDVGKREYEYSLCAKECGISMTNTRLFPSKLCEGYFGIERFDRIKTPDGTESVHMATVAALLELDFEQPSLDYHDLMKLTKILTKGNKKDLETMYRLACFNVFAHNRDDHSKNFSFLYDEKNGWSLSPAYDLTYSNTYYGEHTTSVDGNGKNPGEKELQNVGIKAGISKKKCVDILEEIQEKIMKNIPLCT
jgi:serine/threonine-protein kinase HipA